MAPLVLLPAAARTAAATGDAQELGTRATQAAVYLDITAVSGTSPSLTVTIQDSLDGVRWVNHTAFAAQTVVGTVVLRLDKLGRFVRAVSTQSGTTPSFTYSVQAVVR